MKPDCNINTNTPFLDQRTDCNPIHHKDNDFILELKDSKIQRGNKWKNKKEKKTRGKTQGHARG